MKFNRTRYLPIGKGRGILTIPRPFFLTSTASVATKAILFCRYASHSSARYICLVANSICFRFAQSRYDINPRSRSEHIECVSTYRTLKRISKIRKSGFISMSSVLKDTTLNFVFFVLRLIYRKRPFLSTRARGRGSLRDIRPRRARQQARILRYTAT